MWEHRCKVARGFISGRRARKQFLQKHLVPVMSFADCYSKRNSNGVISIVSRPLLDDRGRITKQSSVCFAVSVGRLEQKCLQLATKSSGRPRQVQLCRQRVPCSRCGGRQRKPCRWFVDVSAARRGRQTTKHAVQIEQVHRQLMFADDHPLCLCRLLF